MLQLSKLSSPLNNFLRISLLLLNNSLLHPLHIQLLLFNCQPILIVICKLVYPLPRVEISSSIKSVQIVSVLTEETRNQFVFMHFKAEGSVVRHRQDIVEVYFGLGATGD